MELTLLKNKLLQSIKFRNNQTLTMVDLIEIIEEIESEVEFKENQHIQQMNDAYNECTNPNN
jgi:hypothetical protein